MMSLNQIKVQYFLFSEKSEIGGNLHCIWIKIQYAILKYIKNFELLFVIKCYILITAQISKSSSCRIVT